MFAFGEDRVDADEVKLRGLFLTRDFTAVISSKKNLAFKKRCLKRNTRKKT